MPNWTNTEKTDEHWGDLVIVKENAAEVLRQELSKMTSEKRRNLRIFMSSTCDPYQAAEEKERVTFDILKVFQDFTDIGLLVIQTRSMLVKRDLELIRLIPYAWLSFTIETNDYQVIRDTGGGSTPAMRLSLVAYARQLGIQCQITVSPCLPWQPGFAKDLVFSDVQRIVVDNFVEGDGSRGQRTAQSPIVKLYPDWANTNWSHMLKSELEDMKRTSGKDFEIGWSSAGFCGIPSRVGGQLL